MARASKHFLVPGPVDGLPSPVILPYLPGQICCVIQFDASGSAVNLSDRRRLYDSVIAAVNPLVSVLVAAEPQTGDDALDVDLRPARLRSLLQGYPAQPVVQALAETGSRELPPWVLLSRPRSSKQPSSMHCYYQVGPAGAARADGMDYVRELVILLNHNKGVVSDSLAGAVLAMPGLDVPGLQVIAVTPNWHSSAAPQPHTGAGPGVPPQPVLTQPPADAWIFTFKGHGELNAPIDADREAGIMIAVLDTSPTIEDLNRAQAENRSNPLLDAVRQNVVIDELKSPVPPHSPSAGTAPIYPKWNTVDSPGGVKPEALRMADHGLFVAGIIHSIVPRAPIRLLRVLDDLGVGNVYTLSQALIQAFDLAKREKTRLVINLSLVAAIPTGEDFAHDWLPASHPRIDDQAGDQAAAQARAPAALRALRSSVAQEVRTAAHAAIGDVVGWLATNGVLVVAAAGNDAVGDASPRPEPRLPARCDSALGVGAMRRDGQAASRFSNRADMFVMGDGIATFGGNSRSADPPAIEIGDGKRVDAILGIVSAKRLPDASGNPNQMHENTTGWAYWAGTSFATPIISAVAVRLWASLPVAPATPGGPTPNDVITALRGVAGATVPALDAPLLEANQQH